MKTRTTLFLAAAALLAALHTARAQTPYTYEHVTISDQNARWGDTITISFTAPDGSRLLAPGSTDTLYLLPKCEGSGKSFTRVIAMHRTSDSTFAAPLVVPDSISSIMINIMTPRQTQLRSYPTMRPHDRAGNVVLGNEPIPFGDDSASRAYRARFPNDYAPFVKAFCIAQQWIQYGVDTSMTAEALQARFDSTEKRLRHDPTPSLARHVVIALLDLYLQRTDTAGIDELRAAAQCTSYDPILDDETFWSYYWRPHDVELWDMVNTRWRILAPLVRRFPATAKRRSNPATASPIASSPTSLAAFGTTAMSTRPSTSTCAECGVR